MKKSKMVRLPSWLSPSDLARLKALALAQKERDVNRIYSVPNGTVRVSLELLPAFQEVIEAAKQPA